MKEGTRTCTTLTYSIWNHSLTAGVAFGWNITVFPVKTEHKAAQHRTLNVQRSCLFHEIVAFWSLIVTFSHIAILIFPSPNLRPLEIIIKTFLYNLRLFKTPRKPCLWHREAPLFLRVWDVHKNRRKQYAANTYSQHSKCHMKLSKITEKYWMHEYVMCLWLLTILCKWNKIHLSYLIRMNNFTYGSECVIVMFLWISAH